MPPTPQYYVDSSENDSSNREDAIEGPYSDLSWAQGRAIALAKQNPDREYYVNTYRVEAVQVFRTVARVELESEVIADPTQS